MGVCIDSVSVCNLYLVVIQETHTMKLSSPVSIVDTDQAGFQVSGWKSLIERQSRE